MSAQLNRRFEPQNMPVFIVVSAPTEKSNVLDFNGLGTVTKQNLW